MKRTVEAMLVGALVLDVAYWSIWFVSRDALASEHRRRTTSSRTPSRSPTVARPRLSARAGLPPDRRPAAHFWLVCAGSAGLYLFGMDFLYDVEHGIFTSGGGGAIEAGIVAITLVFSLTVLRFAWTRRDALLAGQST